MRFDFQPATLTPPAPVLPGLDPGKAPDAAQPLPVKLPGPKAKQAEALFQNIRWMIEGFKDPNGKTFSPGFGLAHVGFLTLTVGDYAQPTGKGSLAKGRQFQKITDRWEAERRFNSLCTNIISKRYPCGVIIRERHKDGGIHYHLVIAIDQDIRTGADGRETLNFEECFRRNRPNYRTANDAIKAEWKFWRDHARAYGFGRCNLQPLRKNAEAASRYMAKYVTKGWFERHPDDKGARCIRYFGHWKKEISDLKHDPKTKKTNPARPKIPAKCQLCIRKIRRPAPRHPQKCAVCLKKLKLLGEKPKKKSGPPVAAKFGSQKPFAVAWRAACKQMEIVTAANGERFTQDNIRFKMGRQWALRFTRKIKGLTLIPEDNLPAEIKEVIEKHNFETEAAHTSILHGRIIAGWKNIVETTPDFWRKTTDTGEATIEQLHARRKNWHENRNFDEVLDSFPGEFTPQNND